MTKGGKAFSFTQLRSEGIISIWLSVFKRRFNTYHVRQPYRYRCVGREEKNHRAVEGADVALSLHGNTLGCGSVMCWGAVQFRIIYVLGLLSPASLIPQAIIWPTSPFMCADWFLVTHLLRFRKYWNQVGQQRSPLYIWFLPKMYRGGNCLIFPHFLFFCKYLLTVSR